MERTIALEQFPQRLACLINAYVCVCICSLVSAARVVGIFFSESTMSWNVNMAFKLSKLETVSMDDMRDYSPCCHLAIWAIIGVHSCISAIIDITLSASSAISFDCSLSGFNKSPFSLSQCLLTKTKILNRSLSMVFLLEEAILFACNTNMHACH